MIPGYRLTGRHGVGSGGVVWAAVSEPGGRRVAIKIVDLAPGAGSWTEAHSEELAALRGVRHPHVVRLVEDRILADGRLALVLEEIPGGSLAGVVRARGHLTAGEVVTLLTSLGTTLADLHRLGVTHADVSPGNVLFQLDGRPMLTDLGVARIAGGVSSEAAGTAGYLDPTVHAGAVPGPASDVYALAALGWLALVGSAPGPSVLRPALRTACPSAPEALAAIIEAGLEPDPGRRMSAADLAYAAYATGPAEPILLAAGADPAGELTHRIRALAVAEATPIRPGRSWRPRLSPRRPSMPLLFLPRLTAVGLLAAVLALGGLGVLLLRPAADGEPAAATSTAAESVAQLASARAAAFGRPGLGPAAFDRPGSPAWRADLAALDRLRGSGLRYAGLRITVGRVEVVAQQADRAELRATVRTSAYDVVDGTGTVRTRVPGTGLVEVTLHLLRTGTGWRVERSS